MVFPADVCTSIPGRRTTSSTRCGSESYSHHSIVGSKRHTSAGDTEGSMLQSSDITSINYTFSTPQPRPTLLSAARMAKTVSSSLRKTFCERHSFCFNLLLLASSEYTGSQWAGSALLLIINKFWNFKRKFLLIKNLGICKNNKSFEDVAFPSFHYSYTGLGFLIIELSVLFL